LAKLRIGFLLQKYTCPKWQYDILDRIEKETNLEICFIGVNGEVTEQQKTEEPPVKQNITNCLTRRFRQVFSLINPSSYGLPHLYQVWDESKHKSPENDLWQELPIPKLNSAKTITLNPIRKGYCHYFSTEQISEIKEHNLDLIIRFGLSIVRGDIHSSAKHGIWSFHHGDNRFYRGGPPGVWELIKGKPEIAVTLQLLTDVLDCGYTIARSTHRCAHYSVYKNKHIIYSACEDLLLQKLLETQNFGFQSIQDSSVFEEEIPKTVIRKSPKNYQFLPLLINNIKTYVDLRWPRNKKAQWFLAFNRNQKTFNEFKNAHLILPPNDRFYADPFLIKKGDDYFVIFEELVYSKGHAHISIGRLQNNSLVDIKPIIEEPFHLSYPFTIEENNEYYAIPESRTSNSLRLYKCVEFPYKWEFQQNIIENVELLDPTIHKQDGTYYLFANQYNKERNTSNESLVVYFSDSLTGPWKEHPLNPIKTNICNSRPAGKVFEHDGTLILPTQNSARRYGYSTNFNSIEISQTHCAIKKINELKPNWKKGNLGSHTWNQMDDITIIDGHRYIDR